jgi:BNR/Asp-box repeat.
MKRPPVLALRLQLSVALAIAVAALGLPVGFGATVAQAATTCTWTPLTSTSAARYRVPSVVRGADGRLFVFAERRNNNYDNDDEGDFDISMATSTDDGCTWSAPRVVSNAGSARVSNPVPVYVAAVDKVLLMTTVKAKDSSSSTGYRFSLNQQWISADGQQVSSLTKLDGWPGMSGTGHAIVLANGYHAGRIVVPLGSTRQDGKRVPRSLISDDNGATWTIGWEQASPGKLKLIEGTVAELTNGSLLASYRDKGDGVPTPGSNRVSAISTDGGASLATTFTAMSGVKTVPTGGSLLQLTGSSNLLLFSSPSNTSGKLTQRKGMRIFISTDQGKSWKKGLAVGSSTDPAYYSDLVQLNDSTVGLVYENGYGSGKSYWHKIAFKQVTVSALNQSLLPTLSKKKSPTVSGTRKVGKTVTAKHGTWSPTVSVVNYQWLRNGKAIASATTATYKLKKADKGKKVSVKVTVASPGYQNAVATSSSYKVK